MINRIFPKISFGLFLILLFIIFSPASFADLKPSPWTSEKSYLDQISHKAGFGILNMGTGWTALFFEPYYEGWKGLGTGLLYTVTDTAGGMIHVATFPIPLDLPLPEGGIAHEYDR